MRTDISVPAATLPVFSLPATPKMAVFFDLDETYRPIDPGARAQAGIRELESFLHRFIAQNEAVIGWVTGSNLDSALRKGADYVGFYPHFISSSLGTELHWLHEGRVEECEHWRRRVQGSGFSRTVVADMVEQARAQGISLREQEAAYQGRRKMSYYYPFSDANCFANDTEHLHRLAAQQGIKIMMTQCNPAAGDPADCFDFDFIPDVCGKDAVVHFIRERFGIPQSNTYAFGDSCNDLAMLAAVGQPFLVGNAAPEAKRHVTGVTRAPYCHGILEALGTLPAR